MEKKLSLEQLKEIVPLCIFDNRISKGSEYTIIIPTYKRPSLLQYALKSALEQSAFDSYEIIVMDNNPERNDETEQFMMQFANAKKLAYFKEPYNIGGTGNWNKATQTAHTDWVVMLHDDDMLYPDFFKVLGKARQRKPQADAIFSECVQYDFSNGELPRRSSKHPYIWRMREQDFLLCNVAGYMVGMAYRKRAWEQIGGFDLDYSPSVDHFFDSQLAHYGRTYKIKYYPTTCYRWFDNDTSRPGVLEAIVKHDYAIRNHILKSKFSFLPNVWQEAFALEWAYESSCNLHIAMDNYNSPSIVMKMLFSAFKSYIRLVMKIRKKIFAKQL